MAYERTKLEPIQAEQQLTWTWENSSCSYLPYRQHENFSHSSTTWTRSLQQQYSNRAGKRRTFLPAQGMGESRVTSWNLPSSWTHTLTNTELESLVEWPPNGTHPEHQAQRVEPSPNFALENLHRQTQWAGWQVSKQRLTRASPGPNFLVLSRDVRARFTTAEHWAKQLWLWPNLQTRLERGRSAMANLLD